MNSSVSDVFQCRSHNWHLHCPCTALSVAIWALASMRQCRAEWLMWSKRMQQATLSALARSKEKTFLPLTRAFCRQPRRLLWKSIFDYFGHNWLQDLTLRLSKAHLVVDCVPLQAVVVGAAPESQLPLNLVHCGIESHEKSWSAMNA